MVKKKILVLVILFLITVACKDAAMIDALAPTTPTLTEMHFISELTLYKHNLYFGAGHCLQRLSTKDQTLTEVTCNQEWVFQKPAIDEQRVYVQVYTTLIEGGVFLTAIDLNTRQASWRIDEPRMTGPYWRGLREATLLYKDQIITIQAQRLGSKMQICAFEAASGQQTWCALPNYYRRTPYFLIQDDLLWYVIKRGENALQNGLVVALDLQTGSINQRINVRSETMVEGLLYIDEQLILGYETLGSIFAIDRTQPKSLLWYKQSPEFARPTSPSLVYDNLFIYSTPETVSALDVTNGQLVWQFNPKTTSEFTQKPAQVVLFTLATLWQQDTPFTLYALDAVSGSVVWTHTLTEYAQPIVSNNVVYIANKSSIDALDMDTGELLWQVSVDSSYDAYINPSGL